MRPRILARFFAEIAQFSAIKTRQDPDAAGPLTSGFDDDFKEIVVIDQSGKRASGRDESKPVFVPCQIEADVMDALSQQVSGNVPDAKLVLVFAYRDLVRMKLIDPATGESLIKANDRLVSVRDKCMCVIRQIRTPPGLYVTQVLPSFGVGGAIDLLMVTLEDREQAARGY